ncbi:GAF domain-containing protein [Aeromicrobium wangtongii]|uniref:GAF domain-containing protein n=1 Tax=Aeromicrobium wangtongii TaxID=2969247 RepID=UPI00201746A0|nr:GAF domain-containing protein [Aeromicrobium wangtongii]MCL3818338.1 GAF domain-containing protein [Aeromicrobium wangtongii]
MPPLSSSEAAAPERPALRDRLLTVVLRPTPPPLRWGVATAAGLIALEVLIVDVLGRTTSQSQFGALFLFGVLVISAAWGFGLAVTTSLASAAAYAHAHAAQNSDSLVPAVVVFTVLALLTNVLVGQARLRAAESEQRRREADLLAALARTMLREAPSAQTLAAAGARLSAMLDLPASRAVLAPAGAVAAPDQQLIVLRDGDTPVGSLLVPQELGAADLRRVRRVVPALEALLAASRDRETLHQQAVTLARQQVALRRIATLVALRADLDDLYVAVVSEIADGIGAEHVAVVAYDDTDQRYTVRAVRDDIAEDAQIVAPGERIALGGHNVCTLVHDTGAPALVDYSVATGLVPQRLRSRGFVLGMGVPVSIEKRIWGVLVVGVAHTPPAPDLQARLTDFAELLATAIHNAETRAQLTASRARVVAAGDQARRTIERDLHDGAQQRIVSLGLELRATQAAVPEALTELRSRLDRSVEALSQIHADLQELSRGIHPAILSRGGLEAALKTLARRSPVPVRLTVTIPERLPEPVEVAAYYAAAEALTNAAKHARATEVTISAAAHHDLLELDVVDDGVGGAAPEAGSGLIGLQDRIDVAGGTLTIVSPPGIGTTLTICIPYTART